MVEEKQERTGVEMLIIFPIAGHSVGFLDGLLKSALGCVKSQCLAASNRGTSPSDLAENIYKYLFSLCIE